MTCYDLIKSFRTKQSFSPYPVFVFRTADGRVLGEYDPQRGEDAWAGDDILHMHREIAYWYMTWDQQDTDVVQLWITIKPDDMTHEVVSGES